MSLLEGVSPEYAAADATMTEATQKFAAAQRAFRTLQIGEAEFLAARAAWKDAELTYDAAYSKEYGRSMSTRGITVTKLALLAEFADGQPHQGHRHGAGTLSWAKKSGLISQVAGRVPREYVITDTGSAELARARGGS